MELKTLDYAMAVLLLVSGIVAFRRGFIKEIFALGSWIAASVIAATYYPVLKPWMLEHHIKNELAASALSGLGLFGLTLLILIPTGNLLAGLIKGPTMTSIDRSMGFVFGLLKGLLIISLFYLCTGLIWQAKEQPAWLSEAKIKPLMKGGADMLKSFVPEDEREKAAKEFEEKSEEIEKAAEDDKQLDKLSTPVPAGKKDNKSSPSYGDELRGIMNDLTGDKNEKNKQ